jgi:hypothetical protein
MISTRTRLYNRKEISVSSLQLACTRRPGSG